MLHVQSLSESLPEGELDPEGQLEQVLDVVAPEAAEYLPLPQSVQADEPAHMQDMSRLRAQVMIILAQCTANIVCIDGQGIVGEACCGESTKYRTSPCICQRRSLCMARH